MKKPIKVVMLPTEDDSYISIIDNAKGRRLNYYCKKLNTSPDRTPQHVYITVSQDVEPIKEGDWYYYPDILGVEGVQQCESKEHLKELQLTTKYKGLKKVIATTDPKITTIVKQLEMNGRSKPSELVPQLQLSFIEEFVKNTKGEWEVEYEYLNNYIAKDIKAMSEYRLGDAMPMKPKLNQDNTVNITAVETIGLPEEELVALCYKHPNDAVLGAAIRKIILNKR